MIQQFTNYKPVWLGCDFIYRFAELKVEDLEVRIFKLSLGAPSILFIFLWRSKKQNQLRGHMLMSENHPSEALNILRSKGDKNKQRIWTTLIPQTAPGKPQVLLFRPERKA